MTREEAIAVFNSLAIEMTAILAGIPKNESEAKQIQRYIDAYDMAISSIRQQDVTDTNVGGNDPLTMDELREMDGEPVWVEHYNGGEWVVVHWNIYGRITTAYNAELRYDEYGERWTAYRQKPEEGTV